MSNLIPQLAQKKIAKEYWVRVLTAWSIVLSLALLVAAVLIYPVYIFTTTQVEVQTASAINAQSVVADFDEVTKQIDQANHQARLVIEDSRVVRASDYVTFFDSFETDTVSIDSVTYGMAKEQIGPITLTGVAASRESLADLRDQLLEAPAVEVVDLPISNLARDRDINFTITVTVLPEIDV